MLYYKQLTNLDRSVMPGNIKLRLKPQFDISRHDITLVVSSLQGFSCIENIWARA